MKMAVTGAAGLIGAHVVREGHASGYDMLALVRDRDRCPALADVDVEARAVDVLGQREMLTSAFDGCEVVIHTAATFAYGGDGQAIRHIAEQGTANVLQAAADANVRRVVVTSSSVVFGYALDGQPLDESAGLADPAGQPAYVAAKIAQDRSALEFADRLGLELVLACPTMSIGPNATRLGPSNGLIVAYLADRTRSSYPGGCNLVSARDVGAAHLLLAEKGISGSHYLLGSENLEWTEIHRLIGELSGVGGPNLQIGAGFARLAAASEEWLAHLAGRAPLSTREQASMIGRFYWYDHARAAALGYCPIPATEAMTEAISWLATSVHVSRELRATLRLGEPIYHHRYGKAVA